MDLLLNDVVVAIGMGLVGAVLFAAVGLVSGTDETTTIAPVTLLVVLLGVPPAGVFTFWLAAAVSKHMTHAIPTALLGIPGALVSAFIAVPLSVAFALLIAPVGQAVTSAAPWVFLAAALLIAYFSAGRWASVVALFPFVLVIVALQGLTEK